MQAKLHVKKGDTVKVIAGDSKNQEGVVLSVDKAKSRAIVEGLNIISKHIRPNATHPQGGIVKQEAAIHVSNLKVVKSAAGRK